MEALLNGPYGQTPLGQNATTLGRTPDNSIVVNDNKASSRHAEIRQVGQDYTIIDFGSTNGTFVNEQRLSPNMPQTLRSGDAVRIGDTRYTFEARNTQPPLYGNAGPVSNPNFPPTEFAPQQYPGTAYGGSPSAPNYQPTQQATSYQQYPGSQPGVNSSSPNYSPTQQASSYQPYLGQQPNSVPPPPQQAASFNQYNQPTQESSYMPPPPPQYNPGQSYNPAQPYSPGQPYNPTPLPGTYQQGVAAPAYGVPPVTPPKRGNALRTVILAALALIVILGAIATFFVVHNNQVAATNAQNTATAQTATAHTAATRVAIAQATGTAAVNATATANSNSQSGDGPYAVGNVALTDALKDNSGGNKWQEDSHCAFAQGVYEVKETKQNTFVPCLANNTNFSNFSYRVALRVLAGDCAGTIFRADANANKEYYYEVCQTGTYDLVYYDGNSGHYLVRPTNSSAIKTGTGSNAINIIAVTANNDTITLYVNGTTLDTVQDATLTSGSIGVIVINDKSSGTDVGFADAKVWSI
jgi:predicted component of type VI protein secretion system